MMFFEPSTNNVPLLQSIVCSMPTPVMCVSPSPRACTAGIESNGAAMHVTAAQQAAVRVTRKAYDAGGNYGV
jgi:hypothetical protein